MVISGQCRSHKIFSSVKAKMEANRGQGLDNVWIAAVENVKKSTLSEELAHNVQHSQCKKDCCNMVFLPSQQVTNSKI